MKQNVGNSEQVSRLRCRECEALAGYHSFKAYRKDLSTCKAAYKHARQANQDITQLPEHPGLLQATTFQKPDGPSALT